MAEQPPAYKHGHAARLRGADRAWNAYDSGADKDAWDAGWRDADFEMRRAAQEAAACGPGPGYAVERPRPKIVQIASVAEGESSMPALFALRDDGTLWVISLVKNDGRPGTWARYPLPPDDKAGADG